MKAPVAVATIEIDGRSFDVFITDNAETFFADFDGERIEAPSKKALHDKLKKTVRTRATVRIPVTEIDIDYHDRVQFRQVAIVGAHGSNRNLLILDEKTGKREQLTYGNSLHRRLSGEEIQAAYKLYKVKVDAAKAWDEWHEETQVNGRELLEAEQAKLVGK